MLSMTLSQVERLLEYRWLVANGIELSPRREEEFRLLTRRASGGRHEPEGADFATVTWEASAADSGSRARVDV